MIEQKLQSNPLVSVIVPTYNSTQFLDMCLSSIKEQSYENIELIVVDNNSTDNTKEIARKYTDKVFNKGPERCAQRNYGVAKSRGEYVAIIDSDMKLSVGVIAGCVEEMRVLESVKGVIIPEESFGEGYWAQCKKLERSFYVGIDWMEAARFFRKRDFDAVGGYNEDLVSGEDWDLSQRIASRGTMSHIDRYIYHNEGHISLLKTVQKKFYYAQFFHKYLQVNSKTTQVHNQISLISRYALFFSQPNKLFRDPLLGAGMLFMKTTEFTFGGIGLLVAQAKRLFILI